MSQKKSPYETRDQTPGPPRANDPQTKPQKVIPIPKGVLRRPLPEPAIAQIQIAVVLPVPILFMLQSEAACYGWRKSTFLEALLMHRLGMGIRLERRADAPKYAFKD